MHGEGDEKKNTNQTKNKQTKKTHQKTQPDPGILGRHVEFFLLFFFSYCL